MLGLPWWGQFLLGLAIKFGPQWLLKLIPSLPLWLQKLIGDPNTIVKIITDFLDAMNAAPKPERRAIRKAHAEKCKRAGGVACESDIKYS